MTQPTVPNPVPKEGEAPTHDVFGSPLKPEELKPVEPEKKQEEGKKPDFDIATHPVVADLTKKLNDQNNNLSEQGQVIKKQAKKLRELEKGEPDEDVKLPYPEIKRSKDLTDDEREEMTSNEIKLMDEKADAQEAANKAAEKAAKAAKADADDGADDEEKPKASDIIASEAKSLAAGNSEREREILEAAKLTSFEGLKTKDEIIARLKLGAEKFIPNWTPPKEQPSPLGGGPVKAGGQDANDPYGVNKIVREARQGTNGNYGL